jgi:hypothetical protein
MTFFALVERGVPIVVFFGELSAMSFSLVVHFLSKKLNILFVYHGTEGFGLEKTDKPQGYPLARYFLRHFL